MDVSKASTPPRPRLWQVLQLMSQLDDNRGSKNSILPSSTFAGFDGFPFCSGGRAVIDLKAAVACFIKLSWAKLRGAIAIHMPTNSVFILISFVSLCPRWSRLQKYSRGTCKRDRRAFLIRSPRFGVHGKRSA